MDAREDSQEPQDLPTDAEVFRSVKSFIDTYGLVRSQIDSFNHFLDTLLPLIVQENSDVTNLSPDRRFSYHTQWTNTVVTPPTTRESCGFERTLTPDSARVRGLTYASNVVCDLCHDCFDESVSPPRHVFRKVYKETIIARSTHFVFEFCGTPPSHSLLTLCLFLWQFQSCSGRRCAT